MALPHDIEPTGLYHVMSRGNYRQPIFHDTSHYLRYLVLLERVARKRGWVVLDWCLMPNHYHLILHLSDAGLSEGMRELNGCYSRWSNAARGLTGTGHLVRNRFNLRMIDTDEYLFELFRYLPLNPVRSSQQQISRPEDWPWSGFRANAGLEHPRSFHRPAELLAYFDPSPRRAHRAYRAHVRSGLGSCGSWSDQSDGGVLESLP